MCLLEWICMPLFVKNNLIFFSLNLIMKMKTMANIERNNINCKLFGFALNFKRAIRTKNIIFFFSVFFSVLEI